MNYLLSAFLFIFSVLFSACRFASSERPTLERQQYTFAGANRCDTTSNTGVNVSVSYFLLKDGSEATQKINDSLQLLAVGSVTSWLDSATVADYPDVRTNLTKAASQFAGDYETMRKDMGNVGGCWELKTTADTVHAGSKAITVQFDTYAYTGGAHPNSNLSFYTFDRETGQLLPLSDMIADTPALLNVVERAFRQQQKLQPRASLEEQGYFLREGRFFLPANVGMSREGLIFYYNSYEIAAYAVGPIRVMVPYTQLGGIVRNDWL